MNSDVNKDPLNAFPVVHKHEYLLRDDFYEMNHVGTRGRSDYLCGHCYKQINKGTPHLISKFYPDFEGPRLHKECESDFMDSLNESKPEEKEQPF